MSRAVGDVGTLETRRQLFSRRESWGNGCHGFQVFHRLPIKIVVVAVVALATPRRVIFPVSAVAFFNT